MGFSPPVRSTQYFVRYVLCNTVTGDVTVIPNHLLSCIVAKRAHRKGAVGGVCPSFFRGILTSVLLSVTIGGVVSVTWAKDLQVLPPTVAERGQRTPPPRSSPSEIRIGYPTSLDPSSYIDVVVPLVERLKSQLPQTKVTTGEIALDQINRDLNGQFDFLLLSGAEAQMIAPAPLPLATLKYAAYEGLNRSLGSVFIVRSDSPIQSVGDMRGHSVAANDEQSFDGWLIAMNELVESGYAIASFFSTKTFTHWQYPDVTTLVLSGTTDVGVLPTCVLERLIAQGAVLPESIRVVGERTSQGDLCRRSTALYPGRQLLALSHVPPSVVKSVLLAVLTIPPTAEGAEWLPNNDVSQLDRLLENLRLGPYAYMKEWSWQALWARYRVWIGVALGLLALLLLDFVRINRIVRRRTAELAQEVAANEEAHRALEASRHRLDLLERASVVSQLSAMIAHDLKQPLTIMVNYLNALKVLMTQKRYEEGLFQQTIDRVSQEAYRLGEIIDRVRQINRREWALRSPIDLRATVERVREYAQLDASALVSSPHEAYWVLGNALEIELVLINVMRNAKAAAHSPGGGGMVRVLIERQKVGEPTEDGNPGRTPSIAIKVEDNGPKITDEVFANLGKLTKSSKVDGMGYGLAIAHSIVEAHQGHMCFERIEPQGIRVTIVLPELPADDARTATNEVTR